MIVFRADGNQKIGTGHIMRCLSIAEELAKNGIECLFVVSGKEMCETIVSRGFSCLVLDQEPWSDLELKALTESLDEFNPSWVVFDSYLVSENYLQKISEKYDTAYLDDLAKFPYPVNLLINYNVYANDEMYRLLYKTDPSKIPDLLTGLSYVPLRESFQRVPVRPQRKTCKDILISTGGADPIHLAYRFITYLIENNKQDGFNYHILVGAMNPDKSKILALVDGHPNIQIHCNVKDMKGLILGLDMAVCAAGSTLYEIAACGLPAVTYILADNQIEGAETFAKMNLMECCGDLRDCPDAPDLLYHKIITLSKDFDKRCEMSERLHSLVDGYGAKRIADVLCDSKHCS